MGDFFASLNLVDAKKQAVRGYRYKRTEIAVRLCTASCILKNATRTSTILVAYAQS
ncbi:MAG: hypothetical protein P1P64_04845 [Treponemataceae bacterium]